jgi:hypothetical protein
MAACSGDGVALAAQATRLQALEESVRQLTESVAALKERASTTAAVPSAAVPPQVFQLVCPQPWVVEAPVGANLWTCRSPIATREGYYPQCSVVFQPQAGIETKDYFEFALNAAPQLYRVNNFKDGRTKLHDAEVFEATFDADRKPLPLKALGLLVPHGDVTYAIACVAPSGSFDGYSPAFRKVLDTFSFL